MSFYKKTNRTKNGRKKREEQIDYYKVEEEKSFYERTNRDHKGRKKKKQV